MTDRKRTSLEDKWEAEQQASGADEAPETGAGDPLPEAGESGREADLEAEIARLRDQLLRQQAEMVNFRRRTERDRGEVRELARLTVLRELLPVIDDFERAVRVESDDVAAYRQGVELILKSLADTLERIGVQRVVPVGEPFDPNLHEAVEREATDAVEPGTVTAVYAPGYVLGERMLRPASVAVAVAPAESDRGDA